MSRLLLVRHGETELNSAERYWGHTDAGLSTVGLKQAEQLRHRLAAEEIGAVYSSDLSRARVTAEIIVSSHHAEITACAELREVNFGELEGLTFAEVGQLYPEVAKLWVAGNPELKYPGGESIEEFSQRVGQFRPRLESNTPQETVLIVAHSASLRILLCYLMGWEPRHWRQLRLDLASLSVLDTYPQGAILNLLNDTSHLR